MAAILKGKRPITADTALQLGRYFGNSPKFWLGVQNDYDVEAEQLAPGNDIASVRQLAVAA